jgi:hypothetical protein
MATMGWRNWRAFTDGEPRSDRWEAALYSDAHYTGDLQVGPYSILNTLPASDGELALSLVLRVGWHQDRDAVDLNMEATDTSRYHGGGSSRRGCCTSVTGFGFAASIRWCDPKMGLRGDR